MVPILYGFIWLSIFRKFLAAIWQRFGSDLAAIFDHDLVAFLFVIICLCDFIK
jgi:hypothetical protein